MTLVATAETGGKRRLIGSKRPLSGRLRQEPSPLCDPESTPEQRNLYLRNMGTDRMQEVNLATTV